MSIRSYFFTFIFFLGGIFFTSAPVLADNPRLPVQDTAYRATYVTQSVADPVQIEAGATREVTITFKNTGSAPWQSNGPNYVTAYTVDEKYRSSAFANSSWISTSQPAKMPTVVLPGELGTLTLSLTAPNTPGTYTEEFYLAANNYTWMQGGYFYLKLKVVPATGQSADQHTPKPTPVVTSKEDTSSDVRASKFFINTHSIESAGGVEKKIRFAVRNESDSTFTNLRVVPVSKTDAMFAHSSWQNSETIATASDIVPGSFQRQDISIFTPSKAGAYTFNFALADQNGIIPGSKFDVDVTVTADAPRSFSSPQFATVASPIQYRYSEESTIRVGLAKIESGSMTFVSEDDIYNIFSEGTLRAVLEPGTPATLSLSGGTYSFSARDASFHSSEYIRLEPATDKSARFTLGGGFERTVNWKGRTDFDVYRGTVEFRQVDDSEKTLYAINELLMEDYVAGIAEASNSASIEFLKAQAVVSRTYAEFIKGTNKYSTRYFDVVAHTGDQLYLGVAIEETTPNYLDATEETRGEMVTYNDEIVITPYFGNSDGTTRSFHDVWGGAMKPWLVPVTTEYDLGRRMYGHGVGMSQRDAMIRVVEENLTYDELLKHYYTGVEIEQMYE